MAFNKTLASTAVAAALSSAAMGSACARDGMLPLSGYQGWGPTANLQTPYSPNESASPQYDAELRAQAQHVEEVNAARESVWAANAPLRAREQERMLAEEKPHGLLAPFRAFARLIGFSRND